MPEEPVTLGDSTELSMSFALQHLERVVKAIPELSVEEIESLASQTDELRARIQGIDDAAGWRRWRLGAAETRRSGRPF